jgi:hypothetical protein
MYFKKGIDDAASEWAQHHAKRWLDTTGKARALWFLAPPPGALRPQRLRHAGQPVVRPSQRPPVSCESWLLASVGDLVRLALPCALLQGPLHARLLQVLEAGVAWFPHVE